MKLIVLAATIGLALWADAAPAPQLVEGKTADAAIQNFRLGHAAAYARPNVELVKVNSTVITFGQGPRPKGSCRMRLKAVELSNWLREKTGFSLIETEGLTPLFPNQPNVVHIVPPALPRPRPHDIPVEIVYGGMSVPVAVARPPFRHREWRPTNFAGRLHKALVTLGPWEGRAVAFVLGCGIGSLLRMLWVLLVVTFRSYRRDPIIEEVVIFEEIDDEIASPPVYADEKVAAVEET